MCLMHNGLQLIKVRTMNTKNMSRVLNLTNDIQDLEQKHH